MSKLSKQEMYDFLMDKLKDFTGRQLQMHGEWLERHINEFVEEYSHIQIGSTVTQILTDENGDALPDEKPQRVKVEKIELALGGLEDVGGIMVHVDGVYSPEYYWNIKKK